MNTTPTSQSRRFGLRLFSHARTLLAVSVFAALAVPTRSLAQAPTFNTLVTTSTGGQSFNHPVWSAAGDFNGDGKLDTVVTNGTSTLRVMLGQGDGTFSLRNVGMPDLAVGNVVDINPSLVPYLPKFIDNLLSIRAADVNGDGRLDFVAIVGAHINWGPYNFIAVGINTGNDANGTPQFAVTYYYSTFTDLRSLTVGDLNGDGKPDFIVGGAHAELHSYLNNGNGTFTALPVFTTVPSAGSPAVGQGVIADLDGDGYGDFAVTVNQGGVIDIFHGNGNGTFQPPVVKSIAGMTSVAAADVNGDGKLDLLAGQFGSPNQLVVYLNAGGGSFSAPMSYSTGGTSFNGWTALAAADLNGDGKLDAVITNSGNNKVAVLLGDGSGSFGAPVILAVNAIPLDLAVGDFNADGKPDIGTVGYNDNTYGVLTNTTPAPLPTQTLTILGGSGTPGNIAPNVEYYNPATGIWQPTYLTGGHPWGFVSGTNSWINYKTANGSDPGAGPTTNQTLWYLYRVRFTVPSDAVDPKMTFSVKADNFAQVAINGVTAGGSTQYINYANINNVIVGQADQVNTDAVFSQSVHPGENTITINVGDWGGLNGFNFRIDLSMKSAQPVVIVPPAPADTTAPVISGPGNIIAEATGPSGKAVTFTATATDNVDGVVPVTASPPSGSTFAIGTTSVGLAASDAAHNTASASFTVTVRDTTPPGLLTPSNVVAEATGPNGAVVTYAPASASDAVGVTSLTYSQNSGTQFPLGVTTVNVTAKDAANNATTLPFTVTVRDTIAPAITVPASQSLEATSAAGAVATFSASASDAVGVTSLTYSAASGSTFAIGATTVTVTAKDASGNTSTASFTVTVKDTIAPALIVPASQTLEASSAAGAVATFAGSATDAVGVTSLTYSSASGSTFAIGTTTVTVTAKDAAGNTTSGSFTITVRDTTPPVITSISTNAPTLWPPNHKMVAVTVSATATDLVGVTSLKIVGVTSSEPDNGLGDGDTANDIEITGNLTVNLRAERSGKGNGRTYTITVQAKDLAGNASIRTVAVFVPLNQGK